MSGHYDPSHDWDRYSAAQDAAAEAEWAETHCDNPQCCGFLRKEADRVDPAIPTTVTGLDGREWPAVTPAKRVKVCRKCGTENYLPLEEPGPGEREYDDDPGSPY